MKIRYNQEIYLAVKGIFGDGLKAAGFPRHINGRCLAIVRNALQNLPASHSGPDEGFGDEE